MRKFLELSKYGIGTITLPYTINIPEEYNDYINDDNDILSDHIKSIISISIENDRPLFFINLLTIVIDVIEHISDTKERFVDFYTADRELVRLKIYNRHIVLEIYSPVDLRNPICVISTNLNLKLFVTMLLNDYKEIIDNGLLKEFTREDDKYIQDVYEYYKELKKLYDTSL